jgi:hypothetical protein
VPKGDCETQVVLHPLAHYDLVGIVMMKGHRIGTVGTFEGNFINALKEMRHEIAFNAG